MKVRVSKSSPYGTLTPEDLQESESPHNRRLHEYHESGGRIEPLIEAVDESSLLHFDNYNWRFVPDSYEEEGMQGQQVFEVEKSKLLNILKGNRAKHIEKYKIAKRKFRAAVIKQMKENLEKAEAGGDLELRINLSKPTLHVEEYDNVIGLLELAKDEDIDVSTQDYKQFCLDQWNWSQQWEMSTACYLNADDG